MEALAALETRQAQVQAKEIMAALGLVQQVMVLVAVVAQVQLAQMLQALLAVMAVQVQHLL